MNTLYKDKVRLTASTQSKGDSSEFIRQTVVAQIRKSVKRGYRICDVGCGNGKLLKLLKDNQIPLELYGMDLQSFFDDPSGQIHFFQKDLNDSFSQGFQNHFEIVVASEVIEHLENPRFFLRELCEITASPGVVIISTPNIESFLSLMTFFFKGYHSTFGPSNYPAHITPVARYELRNMIHEIPEFSISEWIDIPRGRIPGTSLAWQRFFPFLRGKRFSDNFCVVMNKI